MKKYLFVLIAMFLGSGQSASASCFVAAGTTGPLLILAGGLTSKVGCSLGLFFEVDGSSTYVTQSFAGHFAQGSIHAIHLTYFPFAENSRDGRVRTTGPFDVRRQNIDPGAFIRTGLAYQDMSLRDGCIIGQPCPDFLERWRATSVGIEVGVGIRGYKGSWLFEIEPLIMYKAFSTWSDGGIGKDQSMRTRVLNLLVGWRF